eukprot:75797_1
MSTLLLFIATCAVIKHSAQTVLKDQPSTKFICNDGTSNCDELYNFLFEHERKLKTSLHAIYNVLKENEIGYDDLMEYSSIDLRETLYELELQKLHIGKLINLLRRIPHSQIYKESNNIIVLSEKEQTALNDINKANKNVDEAIIEIQNNMKLLQQNCLNAQQIINSTFKYIVQTAEQTQTTLLKQLQQMVEHKNLTFTHNIQHLMQYQQKLTECIDASDKMIYDMTISASERKNKILSLTTNVLSNDPIQKSMNCSESTTKIYAVINKNNIIQSLKTLCDIQDTIPTPSAPTISITNIGSTFVTLNIKNNNTVLRYKIKFGGSDENVKQDLEIIWKIVEIETTNNDIYYTIYSLKPITNYILIVTSTNLIEYGDPTNITFKTNNSTSFLRYKNSPNDSAVAKLTADTFNDFIEKYLNVLVKFYAPWCGHCKALAPEYESAAKTISADDSLTLVLAEVDATVENALAKQFGVKGFPTLKYFTNGNLESPYDYSGGRTKTTIIEWATVHANMGIRNVTILGNTADVEAFKKKASVVLIGFFYEDESISKILNGVAEAIQGVALVGQVTSTEIKVAEMEFGKLYLFVEFDELPVLFVGELTVDYIVEFVNMERFPLIGEIGPDNYKEYIDRGLPFVWISINVDDEDEKQSVINSLVPHAQNTKGELSFVWLDAQKYQEHLSNIGITETPGIMIDAKSISADKQRYLFDGEITSQTVDAFFERYKAGILQAYIKSEPIPESNDEVIFVLVGSQFEDIIGKDKDVFVEFYAPWCGHCKRFAPEYEKVGESFKNVDSMIIAKIDATENDTPEVIKGFPTLIFYPKHQSKGIKYTGEKKHKDVVEWITENASGDMANVILNL